MRNSQPSRVYKWVRAVVGIFVFGFLVFSLLTFNEEEFICEEICGYVWPESVSQGEEISIFTSTRQEFYDVEIYRFGKNQEIVKKINRLAGRYQQVQKDADQIGSGWEVSYRFKIPKHWRSGVYLCKFKGYYGEPRYSFFVVREDEPGSTSPILFLAATSTYHAYNRFGGTNLYGHGASLIPGKAFENRNRKVSTQRPYYYSPGHSDGTGFFINEEVPGFWKGNPIHGLLKLGIWMRVQKSFPALHRGWESKFIQWAEKNGYQMEYATSFDLHSRPNLLEGYQLFISVGHDEYWSKEMRDNLEGFIARGGNCAFFSGNAVWWQIRYSNDGSEITCYKKAKEDPLYGIEDSRVTTRWSSPPVNRSEEALTGVSYRYGGRANDHSSGNIQWENGYGGYEAINTWHWVYSGVGLNDHQKFGRGQTAEEAIISFEVDGALLSFENGVPHVSPQGKTPKDFILLGFAKASKGYGTMGIHSSLGGKVFTAGTTGWALGLDSDPFVARLTKNVMDELSKGKEGIRK